MSFTDANSIADCRGGGLTIAGHPIATCFDILIVSCAHPWRDQPEAREKSSYIAGTFVLPTHATR
jgi:hypothetical protein